MFIIFVFLIGICQGNPLSFVQALLLVFKGQVLWRDFKGRALIPEF